MLHLTVGQEINRNMRCIEIDVAARNRELFAD